MAAEAEDDEEIVSDLTPQEESENNDKSMYHIITKYTLITVLIYQTGYTSPTIVHYLEKFPRKKYRYNNKCLGAIEKRESENDVVWITLQSHQFKRKKVNITKVKGYGTDLMSTLYADPNHREKFFKLETFQDVEKQQHMCQVLSCYLQTLYQSFVMRKKRHGSCMEL